MLPLTVQFWQLYNSLTLFRLGGHEDCKEWQVRVTLEGPGLKCQEAWQADITAVEGTVHPNIHVYIYI